MWPLVVATELKLLQCEIVFWRIDSNKGLSEKRVFALKKFQFWKKSDTFPFSQ